MVGPQSITPKVPIDKIQADQTAQELWVVKITQITKTDKTTQTLITKYPLFVVAFQPGTDVHEILQIKKGLSLHHTMGEASTEPVRQCFNCQSFGHSLNFCGKPPSVSGVINHVQHRNAKKPLACIQNVSTAGLPTQPILPTVLHIHHNSTSYINGSCTSQS
jgi:hypothetical protein